MTVTEGVTVTTTEEWLAFKERISGGSGGETKHPLAVPKTIPKALQTAHDFSGLVSSQQTGISQIRPNSEKDKKKTVLQHVWAL